MVLKSTVIGLVCTVALVALLALSRQFDYETEKVFEVTEIETITLDPPPPPPDLTPPEEQPDDAPPPAPELNLPSQLNNIDAPEITLSIDQVPVSMAMQAFHTDVAPAKLPARPQPVIKAPPAPKKVIPKKVVQSKPAPKKVYPKKAPVTKTVTKSYYSASDLDSKPRQRKTGKYTWPRSAKGKSASVKLLIEINTSGHVKVISVTSSTNAALNPSAMKVASGSLFTPPLYKGKPVKARFYKTYILKK